MRGRKPPPAVTDVADKPVGRHSAGNQIAFYRSAMLWFLPWVIVAIVALAAVWIAVDALGNDVRPLPPTKPDERDAVAVDDPSPSESAKPEKDDDPSPSSEATKTPDEDEAKLITDGISVQVLNGTADAGADDRVADDLEALGYEIEAVNPYLARDKTVVYWSSADSKEAAQALAEHYDWSASAKPQDLSSEVSIHVLLGADAL